MELELVSSPILDASSCWKFRDWVCQQILENRPVDTNQSFSQSASKLAQITYGVHCIRDDVAPR
jgi:hypothetical protein